MRSWQPALVVALGMAAGCSPDEPSPFPVLVEHPIIGGTKVPGQHMAVVFIIARDGAGRHAFSCTGSLIRPRVVMTAAHCADIASYRYEVYFADRYDLQSRTFVGSVDEIIRRAQVVSVHPMWDDDPGAGNDIALFYLDRAAPSSVPPLEPGRYRATSTWLTRMGRMVGFGLTSGRVTTSYGEKLEGRAPISVVQIDHLTTHGESTTCSGDSGGPLLLLLEGREVIVGITSFGYDELCEDGQGYYTRVDRHRGFIEAFIAEHDPRAPGGCAADGACGVGCSEVDPDCPCVADGHCTAACSEPDLDPDCPLACGADGTCQRSGCPVPDPDCGDKVLGESCARNEECATGLCVPRGSSRVCSERCDANSPCAEGFSCSSNRVCLATSGGGCGCAAGGGARRSGGDLAGGWLAAWLAVWLWRRRGAVPGA
jgi:V8-like Glu-specific endopeptidase